MNRPVPQPEPRYAQIAAEIRRRIAAGELRAGDRVPSTRQIVQDWGVAMATATRVLATLHQEGLVRAVPGIGTVVATPEPDGTQPPRAPQPPRARQPPRAARRREAHEPGQELTRERMVRAAIGIADAEGLGALSMRRVAAELGVATMSLYRYVDSKDDLLLLMADAAAGEDRLPDEPPPSWRARLEVTMRLQWTTYRRHPWLAPVLSLSRPQLLPNLLTHAEWALSALDGLGLDPATMLQVHITAFNYVRGTAVNLEPEAEAEQDTGVTSDQWMESQAPVLAAIAASGRYPTLSRITQHDFEFDFDALFEFGLQRMLDGLTVFLENPGEAAHRPPCAHPSSSDLTRPDIRARVDTPSRP